MNKPVKCSKVIKTCKYRVKLFDKNLYCNYICITGSRRGCDPEQCDKYVIETHLKRRWGELQ